MRDLIGERPNVVPSGLGNGNSDMDMSIFGAVSDHNEQEEEGEGEEEEEAGSPTRWGIENDDMGLLSDDEGANEGGSEDGGKPEKAVMANKEVSKLGRTGAKPGNSRPATRPVKENKRKRKIDKFTDIAEAEELTRQRQLELAKAKVEAKQATKQAEYAYKMQKMEDKMERRKQKNEERAAKMHLLRLREERGMGPPNSNSGTHAVASGSGSLGFSSMFAGTSASGSYYRTNSPTLPVNNHTSSSGMDEFAFAHISETPSSYSSGQSSEHGTERMGSPSSSSMYR
jgi:hypothetical protein